MTLALLCPARAYALLGWLGELSGPGPFTGWLVTMDVACVGGQIQPDENVALLGFVYAKNQEVLNKRDPHYAQNNPVIAPDPVATFDGILRAMRKGSSPDETQFAYTMKKVRKAEGVDPKDSGTLRATFDGGLSQYASELMTLTAAMRPDNFTDPTYLRAAEEYQRRFRRCRADRSNNIVSVQLEVGRYKDTERGDRYTGNTQLWTITAIAFVPAGRLWTDFNSPIDSWGRFVELGAGVGSYGLTGTSLEHKNMWRGTLALRARLIPSELVMALRGTSRGKPGIDVAWDPHRSASRWRRFAQAVEYRFGWDLILGEIDSRLYGPEGPKPATPQGHEWVNSHGLNVDLGMLMRAALKR